MAAKTSAARYDPVENVVYVWHPEPVHLETRADIALYFEANRRFWRDHCGGKKAYFVIDFEGVSTNAAHRDCYADCIKAASDECAITVVRYGGDMLQRLASRMAATHLHVPSNVYRSRDEALAVVQALRQGMMKLSR
jgi:hypothetical protein